MRTLEKDITACTAADIMQTAVTTVPPEMPLSEVARVLWDHHLSGAPVVDAAGNPIGVVSAADIVRVRGYGARYPRPGSIPPAPDEPTAILRLLADASDTRASHATGIEPTARDVMTPATFTVRPTATVPELARFLARARIHRALVMEHERLVGIVTTFDIATELARYAEPAQLDELPLQEDADIEC